MDHPYQHHNHRRDYNSNRGGGGGGNYYAGGGRGRHHGRGGGRHHNNRHHRNNNNNRGHKGNRFEFPQRRNPQQELFRNLMLMLHKVGECSAATENAAKNENKDTNNTGSTTESTKRPLVQQQQIHIRDLCRVLVDKADLFLKDPIVGAFGGGNNNNNNNVAPWVLGVVHVVSGQAIAGPCLAGLTRGILDRLAETATEGSVAPPVTAEQVRQRLITYLCQQFGKHLDDLLLVANQPEGDAATDGDHPMGGGGGGGNNNFNNNRQQQQNDDTPIPLPVLMSRCQLWLQYLTYLGRAGLVQTTVTEHTDDIIPAAIHGRPIALQGLWQALVQAAGQAAQAGAVQAAMALANLVLATLPHLWQLMVVTTNGDENAETTAAWMEEHLVQPLAEMIGNQHVSPFAPGDGLSAILLKNEQIEDVGADVDEDDDEEDDDDDDDDDQAPAQVCDSLQDLLRTVQHLLKTKSLEGCSTLCLFQDAPWDLGATEGVSNMPPPLELDIFPHCELLAQLLSGKSGEIKMVSLHLPTVIWGRLPIFGPPPELQDDDEEEDEEEAMDDKETVPESLQAYQKLSMVDRVFLANAVVTICHSHEPIVTLTGVTRGNTKAVAEQIWSLQYMLPEEQRKGLEYAIVETLLTMIVQTDRLTYVSRILLELTRLEPKRFSAAIAMAVATLHRDYLPTLVPTARQALATWLAYHLLHTDYQWPAAYWQSYAPYLQHGWGNSRGAFAQTVLNRLMENESDLHILVRDGLPANDVVLDRLVPPPSSEPAEPSALVQDIIQRTCEQSESPGSVLATLLSDETSESMTSESMPAADWRMAVLAQTLGSVLQREYKQLVDVVAKARSTEKPAEEEMDVAQDGDDFLSVCLEWIRQYRTVFEGILTKEESEDAKIQAQTYLLYKVHSEAEYSRAALSSIVSLLLELNIVSRIAIVRWALGDIVGHEDGKPIVQWWEMTTTAVRDQSTTVVKELVEYMLQRVCHCIPTTESDSDKRMTNSQVVLVEGLKQVINDAFVQQQQPEESDLITGSGLLELCPVSDGKAAIETLRSMLERLD